MTKEEVELQVLLSEKEHADQQIASHLELQIKLLAFLLGTGSVGLGFVFAKGDKLLLKPPEIAIVIIVSCVAGCVVILLSTVTYGVALGYIYYKKELLAPRLKALFQLPELPRFSFEAFHHGPVRIPVLLAATLLAAVHAITTGALLAYASWLVRPTRANILIFTVCWLFLIATLLAETLLACSMSKVGGGTGAKSLKRQQNA